MREIKFRAYDGVNEAWHIIKLEPCSNFSLNFDAMGINSRNFTDWQQFTGLKDKNGKEIYEGDIVDITFTDTVFDKNRGIVNRMERGIVKWDGGTLSMKNGWTFSGVFSFHVNSIEVIGNIHENPELIK